MIKPRWYFFQEPSPKTEGWNDPAAQHFTGHQVKGLVRESIQNSLDNHAENDGKREEQKIPVIIKFEIFEINKDEVPDLDNYRKHLEAIKNNSVDDEAKDGASEALNVLARTKIRVLKIGDYNTKGASGSDLDENSNWYRLVQSVGSSQKRAGSGGSFGIGKSSFLANSALRMIFFSTKCYKSAKTNFIGISRLCTHHFENLKLQEKGYCSIDHGKAISSSGETLELFKRKEPGLDVFVIGLRTETQEAFQKIVEEVCANYFAAIADGLCEIDIKRPGKGIVINKGNIKEVFNEYLTEENSGLFSAFKAYTEGKVILKDLKYLNECELKILVAESMPNRVAYLRRGMLIRFKNFQCPIRYTATFRCVYKEDEDRLRKLEPPAHNDWETDRSVIINDNKVIGKEILKEIEHFIRSELSKLYDSSENDSISLKNIQKLFRTDIPERNHGQAKGDAEKTSDFPEATEQAIEFEASERKPLTTNNFPNIGNWADLSKIDDEDEVIDPDDEKMKTRKTKKRKLSVLQPSSFLKDYHTLEAELVTWKDPRRKNEYQVRLIARQDIKNVFIIFGWQDIDGDIDVIKPEKVLLEKTKKLKDDGKALFGPFSLIRYKKYKISVFTSDDTGYGLAASIYKKK